MKDFNTTMAELAESVRAGKNGKAIKTFSKKEFENVFTSFLNETQYETTVYATKGEGFETSVITPVAEFRKTFYNTLIDFGVDKQEAAKMLDGTYQFTKAPGSYAFISEVLEQYLKYKKFAFQSKEDFNAVIRIDDIEETEREYSSFGSDKKRKKEKKHRRLKVSSSTPKWKKEDLN